MDGEAVPSDLSWKRAGRARRDVPAEVVVDNGKADAGQHDGRDCPSVPEQAALLGTHPILLHTSWHLGGHQQAGEAEQQMLAT